MNYSSLYGLVDHFPLLSDPAINQGYPPEKLIECVAIWCETHSLTRIEELSGVSRETIRQWMAPLKTIDAEGNEVEVSWWSDILEQVREYIRDTLEARLTAVTEAALSGVEDRLERGDHVVTRSGNTIRVPVKAKDLSTIAAQLLDRRANLVKERTEKEALALAQRKSEDAIMRKLQTVERYLLTKTEGEPNAEKQER